MTTTLTTKDGPTFASSSLHEIAFDMVVEPELIATDSLTAVALLFLSITVSLIVIYSLFFNLVIRRSHIFEVF